MLNRQQARHEKGKRGHLLEWKENVNFYTDGLDRGTRMNWANSLLSHMEVFSSKIVAEGRHTTSGTNSCMANKLNMKWLTMTSSHWPTYLTRRERRRSRKRERSFANLRILENILPISESCTIFNWKILHSQDKKYLDILNSKWKLSVEAVEYSTRFQTHVKRKQILKVSNSYFVNLQPEGSSSVK